MSCPNSPHSQAHKGLAWCLCSLCFLPSCPHLTRALFTNNFQTPAPGFTYAFAFKSPSSAFTFSKVNLSGQGFLPTPLYWAFKLLEDRKLVLYFCNLRGVWPRECKALFNYRNWLIQLGKSELQFTVGRICSPPRLFSHIHRNQVRKKAEAPFSL